MRRIVIDTNVFVAAGFNPLQGKVLVYGRHPGIADQHRFRRDVAGIGCSRSRALRRHGTPPLRVRGCVSSLSPFDRHHPLETQPYTYVL
jgi:hypothetical protein